MPDSLSNQPDPSAAFPRSARLLTSADFGRVFADARSFRDAKFTLLIRPGTHPSPRLGFVLAKKKVRLAVTRNRLRRVVRESFRHHIHALPAVDIIFLAKPGAGDLTNEQLRYALERQWRKLKKTESDQEHS